MQKKRGVIVDIAQCAEDGTLDPQKIEDLIRPETKAVMMLHASNVCGTLLPIEEIGEICERKGVFFLLLIPRRRQASCRSTWTK